MFLVLKELMTEKDVSKSSIIGAKPLVAFRNDSKDACVEYAMTNEEPFVVYTVVQVLGSYTEE